MFLGHKTGEESIRFPSIETAYLGLLGLKPVFVTTLPPAYEFYNQSPKLRGPDVLTIILLTAHCIWALPAP